MRPIRRGGDARVFGGGSSSRLSLLSFCIRSCMDVFRSVTYLTGISSCCCWWSTTSICFTLSFMESLDSRPVSTNLALWSEASSGGHVCFLGAGRGGVFSRSSRRSQLRTSCCFVWFLVVVVLVLVVGGEGLRRRLSGVPSSGSKPQISARRCFSCWSAACGEDSEYGCDVFSWEAFGVLVGNGSTSISSSMG